MAECEICGRELCDNPDWEICEECAQAEISDRMESLVTVEERDFYNRF